jgi:hypothetical protein
MNQSVEATCAKIEALCESLLAVEIPGVELGDETLEPQSAAALTALEDQLGTALPPDVRTFLGRGLCYPRGMIEVGERFASLGFTFLEAPQIVEHTQMLREVGKSALDPHASIIARGLALTYEEPQIVVSDGVVYHFSFRNPMLRVTDSFETFLAHWLASGCFGSHDFGLAWEALKSHVPEIISPENNCWIRAYKSQFPSF